MRFTAQQKLEILKKVLEEKNSVAAVCREAGISRKTFYQWKKRFLEAPSKRKLSSLAPQYKKGKSHPRSRRLSFKRDVLSIVAARPDWGSKKICKAMQKHAKVLSPHAVYSLLKDLNLRRLKQRERFSRLYQGFAKIKAVYKAKPVRLTPETRKKIIEEVLIKGRTVSEVCRQYYFSRKAFYKWKARYEEASQKGESLLAAMEDRYSRAEVHPRGVGQEVIDKIFSLVVSHPEYSTHKISQILAVVGNHGVQNVLERYNLNTYQKRLIYSEKYAPAAIFRPAASFYQRVGFAAKRLVLSLAPAPAAWRKTKAFLGYTALSAFLTFGFSLFAYQWLLMFSGVPLAVKIGLCFASISLLTGSFFFLYSMKYYLALALVLSFSRETEEFENGEEAISDNSQGWLHKIFNGRLDLSFSAKVNNHRQGNGLKKSIEDIELNRHPFVSIHLPFYNEKRVAKRLLKACVSMDYPNFEVIVCDDSNDETVKIVQRYANVHNRKHPEGPLIKVLHRSNRSGFKGGALKEALKKMNPRTEFICIFDADFVPYPDTIEQFLRYFKANGLNLNRRYFSAAKKGGNNLAAITGYQWHVLNKSENWITRGVRTEYAGSYVIERPSREIAGSLKQIHGSVYMIRADVLKEFGWGTSITEDFELTLKLYAQGYKVIYTPYIQAPAECVSTLKRLIRQRMRWAEGHSYNIKKMFGRLMFGHWWPAAQAQGRKRKKAKRIWVPSPLSWMEKIEFLYLSPYYLQAALFIIGTLSWLISEAVFGVRLPFWTTLWGWSLVLTNMLALPLMNAAGLFLEESEEKDYLGLLSFVILSYLLVPFQAYAAVKGFLEKEEGTWFRTPKTGRITDIFNRGRFYRWIRGILPWRIPSLAESMMGVKLAPSFSGSTTPSLNFNPYLALATANNRFNTFKIRRRQRRGLAALVMIFLILFSSTLFRLLPTVPYNKITPVQAQGKIRISSSASGTAAGGSLRTGSSKPKITAEEHSPRTRPQDFYIDLNKIAKIEADGELDSEPLDLSSMPKNGREIQQKEERIKAVIKEKMKTKIKKFETLKEKELLPYYYRQTESGYQLFLRSEKGIQRYTFDKNSLNLSLAERETDRPGFIDKAISKPIFQYQNSQGSWQDYIESIPLNFKLQEFDSYLLLTASFNLFARGASSLAAPAEIKFKLGFDGKRYINKLSFKLGSNGNLNRLVWETKFLEGGVIKEDNSNVVGSKKSPGGGKIPVKRQLLGRFFINWSDFGEKTRCEQSKGENANRVYFYEQGIKGGFEVDPTLSITAASTTITVTSNNTPSWQMRWNTATGGLVDTFYTPSNSTDDLASGSTVCDGMFSPGAFISLDWRLQCEDTAASLQLIENSDTRVVIRAEGVMETATYGSGVEYYYIYPDRMVIHYNITTGADAWTIAQIAPMGMAPADIADNFYMFDVDTLAAGQTFDAAAFYDNPAGVTGDIGVSIQDVLTGSTDTDFSWWVIDTPVGISEDNRHSESDDTTYSRSVGLAASDTATLGTNFEMESVLRITNDNTTDGSEAQNYAEDYWQPDDLSDNIGVGTSGWFDSDENTASSTDFWNEKEGAYCLQGTMGDTQFAQFDLDGGAASYNRYMPFFKIRGWRKYTEPSSVTLEGVSQTDGTNYNMDIAPFSESWVYDSGGTWTKLADGGDTADADEYLDDSTNNFDFDQATFDIFDNAGDYFYLGSHDQFTGVNLDLATVGTGTPTLTWEYCSANTDTATTCDTWSTLTVTDTDSGASNMTASGNFYFADPSGWVASTENSGRKALWWIRAHLSAGSFTDYPVENTVRTDIILLQYLSDISANDQTFVVVPEYLWPFLALAPLIPGLWRKKRKRNKV